MKHTFLLMTILCFGLTSCTPDTPENQAARDAGREALRQSGEALTAARDAIKEATPLVKQEIAKLRENFSGKFEGTLKSGGRMILDIDGNGTYKQFVRKADGTEEVSGTGKWVMDTNKNMRLTDAQGRVMEFQMTGLNELQLLDPNGNPVQGSVLKYIVLKK